MQNGFRVGRQIESCVEIDENPEIITERGIRVHSESPQKNGGRRGERETGPV